MEPALTIRPLTPDDAADFLTLGLHLDEETKFMALEPGERNWSVDRQKEILQSFLKRSNNIILLARWEGQVCGYVGAEGGAFRRNRHAVTLSIGVRQAFARRGIGTRLMLALEEWARGVGVERLGLTTLGHNLAAQGLYRKLGYEQEGVRRDSVRVDGVPTDELCFAKLLRS
jgi:RimJ/RimL family protein N-acetyltransferase